MDAFISQPLEPALVEGRADERRRIELPVARVKDEAEVRADRNRAHLGNRMRERHELDIEGADLEPAVEPHDVDRQLQAAAHLGELRAQHAGGERRRIDRRLEARPQLDHRPDVVLVRVRDQHAGEVGTVLLDEAHIGQDHVDAGIELALGKRDPAIDHEPPARLGGTIAVEVEVHADLAEAAERHEYELVCAFAPA